MARERHVYPTDEISHIWMHQSKADARNPQGNLFFEGKTIYSYRTSYPLAEHVENAKGEKAILLRAGPAFSVTTAGHLSLVRHAIPSSAIVFEVPNVRATYQWAEPGIDHATNLDYFVEQSKEALAKAQKSRKYGLDTLSKAFDYEDQALKYAAFFEIPTGAWGRFSFLPQGEELDALQAKLREREERAEAVDKVRRAKQEAKWAEESRIRALKAEEQIELWKQGNPHAHVPWGSPTMLRVKGDEVETSKGARVPVEHARRILRLVRIAVAKGQDIIPTSQLESTIGYYKVDRIESSGTLHAGCHVIAYDEIERIAPALESLQEVA